MHHAHGYTLLDMFTIAVLITVVLSAIIWLANPGMQLKKQYDAQRVEDVRNITEALIEYDLVDPDGYNALVEGLDDRPTMIGSADSCAGSYGIQCDASVLHDNCVDLEAPFSRLLGSVPFDHHGDGLSSERTGYFLKRSNNHLIVGSCNPQSTSNIEISTPLN